MNSEAYLMCSDCGPRNRSTKFAVVVDEEHVVHRYECARCGSSNVERVPEADY